MNHIGQARLLLVLVRAEDAGAKGLTLNELIERVRLLGPEDQAEVERIARRLSLRGKR